MSCVYAHAQDVELPSETLARIAWNFYLPVHGTGRAGSRHGRGWAFP
jgi:hypothetical protein